MICDTCNGTQFYSRYDRKTGERIAWVCSQCGQGSTRSREKKKRKYKDNLPEEVQILDTIIKGD